jgi:DNA-binding transcriptional regulator YiaG
MFGPVLWLTVEQSALTDRTKCSIWHGMNGSELRTILEAFGLSQADFAKLISVSTRAVSLWLSGEREVSGPAAAYLRLLESLPAALQVKEITRIKEKDASMLEGMYAIKFRGQSGEGIGVLVLDRGRIYGSDTGVMYDGTYAPSTSSRDHIDAHIRLTVPPGVALVTGIPAQPMSYGFDIDCTINPRSSTPVTVQTPFDPVEVVFTFLRNLPQ